MKVRSRTVCLESECTIYLPKERERTNQRGKKEKKKKIVKFILHFLLVVCFFNYIANKVECSSVVLLFFLREHW